MEIGRVGGPPPQYGRQMTQKVDRVESEPQADVNVEEAPPPEAPPVDASITASEQPAVAEAPPVEETEAPPPPSNHVDVFA